MSIAALALEQNSKQPQRVVIDASSATVFPFGPVLPDPSSDVSAEPASNRMIRWAGKCFAGFRDKIYARVAGTPGDWTTLIASGGFTGGWTPKGSGHSFIGFFVVSGKCYALFSDASNNVRGVVHDGTSWTSQGIYTGGTLVGGWSHAFVFRNEVFLVCQTGLVVISPGTAALTITTNVTGDDRFQEGQCLGIWDQAVWAAYYQNVGNSVVLLKREAGTWVSKNHTIPGGGTSTSAARWALFEIGTEYFLILSDASGTRAYKTTDLGATPIVFTDVTATLLPSGLSTQTNVSISVLVDRESNGMGGAAIRYAFVNGSTASSVWKIASSSAWTLMGTGTTFVFFPHDPLSGGGERTFSDGQQDVIYQGVGPGSVPGRESQKFRLFGGGAANVNLYWSLDDGETWDGPGTLIGASGLSADGTLYEKDWNFATDGLSAPIARVSRRLVADTV